MNSVNLPDGYRILVRGEKILKGDLFLNISGKWLSNRSIWCEGEVYDDTYRIHCRKKDDLCS